MTAQHPKSDVRIETAHATERIEAVAIMRVAATIDREAVIVLPLVRAVPETAVTTMNGKYRIGFAEICVFDKHFTHLVNTVYFV